jgi:hypothetical protein
MATITGRYPKQHRLGATSFSRDGGDVGHAGKSVTSTAVQLARSVPTLRQCICDACALVSISDDTLEFEHGSGGNIRCGMLQNCPFCTTLDRALKLQAKPTELLYRKSSSLQFRLTPDRKIKALLRGGQDYSITTAEVDLEIEYIDGLYFRVHLPNFNVSYKYMALTHDY